MTFRKKLHYFLVKKLQISNKIALEIISNGDIKINQSIVYQNIIIDSNDEIEYKNEILQVKKELLYFAFYKPVGIETTLNENIKNNLKAILPNKEVFPIGRLDKASEGLIILTNDGTIYDKILRKEFEFEKEYLVETDKEITVEFIKKMSEGIVIMGKKTLPCKVEKITNFSFKITLIQGLNRQIRRMTYKLNYEVLKLIRIRIGAIEINDLLPGEFRRIEKLEIFSTLNH